MKEFVDFLEQKKVQESISSFCSMQSIDWKFIPEHAPHFGGTWESMVKSAKSHLRLIVGTVKLPFEELNTYSIAY